MIGPLTSKTRMAKVKAYWAKKQNKSKRGHIYKCRKQVAEKRLRIRGRFVTRIQALDILGLTEGQLFDNGSV